MAAEPVNTNTATGRSSKRASPTERKSMMSSAGFPSSSATGRRATWSQVSSTRDAAAPVQRRNRQGRSTLQQPERRRPTTRAVQRAFGRREISCGPAMDYQRETKPRRPGRDVARRRVEPACAPPGFKYVESARPRKGSSTTSTNHGGVCLYYEPSLHARTVQLPVFSTFEVVAAFLHRASFNVVVVYLPWLVQRDAVVLQRLLRPA